MQKAMVLKGDEPQAVEQSAALQQVGALCYLAATTSRVMLYLKLADSPV